MCLIYLNTYLASIFKYVLSPLSVARFGVFCVRPSMDGVGQHIVEQLSVLNSIRSIFEDFNLVGLSEDVYIHVLNIVSSMSV